MRKILCALLAATLIFGFSYVFYFRTITQVEIVRVQAPVPAFEIFCTESVKKCNVVLSDTIESTEYYLKLGMIIRNLPSDWSVNIQLVGKGGEMDSVYYIQNTIEKSQATITMEIVGPVYSAHAFLSMLGDKIEIDNQSFLMFHRPAIYNPETKEYVLPVNICKLVKGLDRGQSSESKCIERMRANARMYDRFFELKIKPHLSAQELLDYELGKDLYIDGKDMQERLK